MGKFIAVLLALGYLGIANADNFDNNQKIDSLTRQISEQTGRERIETLILLSEVYRKFSVDKSLETDSIAEEYADIEGLESMKGVIMLSLGKTASLSGDYTLALDYMQKAAKALDETENYTELAKTYLNLGLVYKNMAQFDKSIEQFNRASEIAHEHDLIDQVAGTAANRANVYFSLGDFKNAMESYQEAVKIYKQLNDSLRYAKMLMNVGLVYWQWDQNELALEMLIEAKKVFEAYNDFVELGRVYNNIGRIYYQEVKDTTKALEYYEQSLSMREKHGNQLGMAVVLANIGNIYRDKKQFDKAFQYYEKSLTISKFIGYREGEALANYYMGIAQQLNSNFAESNRLLDSCMLVAQTYGMSAYYSPVNESKMTNYAAMGDYTGFMAEFKTYAAKHDTLEIEMDKLKYKELATRQELEKVKPALELANTSIKKLETRLLSYKIAVGALILLLFITVLSRRKKNQKQQSDNPS
ncbi:MAG: tetratricopeptide repeat protein [Bacteroidetes bacterium]|nr:tetratricopeptide repeat protein [Bacteroidota bacterium]MBU1577932.1 tetratricopeptide repeat protein [Bacteroidota bacterium]MBU2466503.1 tetratricopeptide repeat protein [Bacteroidota bacterium]MBU2556583.1 tetratricopeptide repeat protein [Bacteroidota bacterium]